MTNVWSQIAMWVEDRNVSHVWVFVIVQDQALERNRTQACASIWVIVTELCV